MKLLACATQGAGSGDEDRLKTLLSRFHVTFFAFTRRNKRASFFSLMRLLRRREFDLFVLEGTGIAGGMAAILGRICWSVPYVLSSGDAVAPFLSSRVPLGKLFFMAYEKALYSCSSGIVGWTPYLVGRALSQGARRAITIPGWAPFPPNLHPTTRDFTIRDRLGIPREAVVFGLAGSLNWFEPHQYCYGAELVRAARASGVNIFVLVVGDGSGLAKLQSMAGDLLNKTIFLTGRVPRHEVPAYLGAMDVGCIPQSVDGIGSFRYTIKLSEYKAACLPFVSTQIPMAYDLDDGDILRLPGASPWDPTFVDALAALMKEFWEKGRPHPRTPATSLATFDRELQVDRMTTFLHDVLRATLDRKHAKAATVAP